MEEIIGKINLKIIQINSETDIEKKQQLNRQLMKLQLRKQIEELKEKLENS